MKIATIVSLLLLSGLSALVAQGDRKDGISTSGKIGWHVVKTDEGADVLISEADQGESAAQKIGGALSVENTQVLVAPDDSWIIVQSGGASLGVFLTAYRREKGMIYHEEKELDITSAVLLAACGGDQKKADAMDHVYAAAAGWSRDSKSILVQVSARGGNKEVGPFYATYDLAGKKVGFDLGKLNGGK